MALADGGSVEAGCGGGIHGDGLRDLVGASSSGLHGEGYLVGTRLCVGMCGILSRTCLIVTEVPLVAIDALSCRSAGELSGLALADGGGVEARSGGWVDGDGFGDVVGAVPVACRHGQCRLVGAGSGIGVCRALPRTCLPVAEVPLVAADGLSAGVGGGGAGKLCGLALANRGRVEVGRRLGIHHDGFSSGAVALVAHGDGAGVGACHGHGAVGA